LSAAPRASRKVWRSRSVYPKVFDGIVAGAPGFSLPRAAVAEAWDTQAFASLVAGIERDNQVNPGKLTATFSNAQFARVRKAVLAACDAEDGGSGESAGLGLSIVASIARAHDAEIGARANPGGGLELTVQFRAIRSQ
jgi:hypothetical protein